MATRAERCFGSASAAVLVVLAVALCTQLSFEPQQQGFVRPTLAQARIGTLPTLLTERLSTSSASQRDLATHRPVSAPPPRHAGPPPPPKPAGPLPSPPGPWALRLLAPLAWALSALRRGSLGGAAPPPSLRALALDETADGDFDPRAFRRSLNKTGRYNRQVLKDEESVALMESDGVGYSRTGLVAKMRSGNFEHVEGDVTVVLANAYGFCWGVERAVQMAYETRKAFPDQKIAITNEIIHNPGVNAKLQAMGIEILEGNEQLAGLREGDVAVLPAFGASVHVMKDLADRNVQIVDTTCPWVSKVWNAVGNQRAADFTSIMHGKWAHEETVATVSFAGNYLVVKDLKGAQYLSNYILTGGDKQEFLDYFGLEAMSKGFDPETMLDKVGLANQTTMLKGETEAIGKLLESTMMQKHGPQNLSQHFNVMDTICDATQERQDAMYDMLKEGETFDLVLVVGGFNSSNTSHLQEICDLKGVKGYWIDSAARIDEAANSITHRTYYGELVETKDWLPPGKIRIGITSGASTPDKAIEDALEKVFRMKNAK